METKKRKKKYNLRFIDYCRFMNMSLDKLVDNLSEINIKTCLSCKERNKTTQYYKFIKLDKNRLMYKCLNCNDKSYKSLQPLIDKFPNTHRLSKNNDEFILLLRKGVYPYEHMDNWNKFNDSIPLGKDKYYSELNTSSISDSNLKHVEKVCNTFKIRDLGKYHDSYVQSDTLLLTDVFEAFRKTCINIYELDPMYFVSLPGFAWTAMSKLTKVELELLTDEDMLLMFEEGTRGISQAIHKHAKANNKYMKSYNKMVISSYIQYLDANNL